MEKRNDERHQTLGGLESEKQTQGLAGAERERGRA